MDVLKIATWNISCGIPAEWSISNGIKKEKDYKKFGLLEEVIQKINDENIDIIGLQIKSDLFINFITGHAPAFQVFGKIPEDYGYVYKKLEKHVETYIKDNKKFFIVGDYNTEKLLEMLPFIRNNFKNYIEGVTYFEGTSIDYILAENNIKCLSNKKLDNKSDHLLCIADFQL